MAKLTGLLGTPFPYRCENIGDRFAARFGAEIPFAVNADADAIGVQVPASDHELGADFHLFGALGLATVPLG